MANILKVTTPPAATTGYNQSVRGSQMVVQNPNIKNPTDPTRVPRSDEKGAQDALGRERTHYLSNYNKFLESIHQSPPLAKSLGELMNRSLQGTVVASPDVMRELNELGELIVKESQDLGGLLKTQLKSSTGYSFALFDLLRTMMKDSSVDFQMDVLKFAKLFNDLASNQRILGNILQNLHQLAESMPKSDAEALLKLTEKLDANANAGDTRLNLEILKNEILPTLSKYTGRTNDLGLARDLMSHLALNISRYESGSFENSSAALRNLTQYEAFAKMLGHVDHVVPDRILHKLLQDKATIKNPIADKINSLIEKGLTSERHESRAVFEQIARSVLTNESVYMPLVYTLLPAEIDGQKMLSEMWIDPESRHDARNDSERVQRVYIRFNIAELGNFDLVMNVQNKKVDLQLLCPSEMEKDFRQIRSDLARIIEQNDLRQNNLYVEAGSGELKLTEVFPKITEGRNSINVSI